MLCHHYWEVRCGTSANVAAERALSRKSLLAIGLLLCCIEVHSDSSESLLFKVILPAMLIRNSWLLILTIMLFGTLGYSQGEADTEASAEENAETAEEAAPAETPAPAQPEPPREKTKQELREEMVERLADQISRRMQALKEREAAVAARESSVSEREKTAADREKMLGAMEELMQMREEVVKRREKLPPPQTWKGGTVPSIYGKYAAVIDGKTMQFYYKKDAHAKVPVASTQKLLTALVICHEGNLDDFVEVPEEVLKVEPTVVGVKPGERYTKRQLLTSLLVKSGNDIATTLAIDSSGSVEAFAEKMNTFARFIGMEESNFVNPHGLPAKGQYSTARDIAIAAFEAYQVPDIREMVQTKTYEFVFTDGRKRTLYNTNRNLGKLDGCNGMKTGFTYAAGNCLVCSVSRDGEERISVILKSGRPMVSDNSRRLLEWALEIEKQGPMESPEKTVVSTFPEPATLFSLIP